MLPVQIVPIQDTLVLRARGSELFILPQHIVSLKATSDFRTFCEYFMAKALINRPARKLFEAWLRKDPGVWKRIFKTVHEEMELKPEGEDASASKTEHSEAAEGDEHIDAKKTSMKPVNPVAGKQSTKAKPTKSVAKVHAPRPVDKGAGAAKGRGMASKARGSSSRRGES